MCGLWPIALHGFFRNAGLLAHLGYCDIPLLLR